MSKTNATLYTHKAKFLPKIKQFNLKILDGLEPSKYSSQASIFIPKLNKKYITPCVMLSMSNGRGSVLIRAKSPIELAEYLDTLSAQLRSDDWLDVWERLMFLTPCLRASQPTIDDTDLFD